MSYRTRFNPSTSGGLHLGHVYMALVNQHLAHSSGGQFIVRVDDKLTPTAEKHGQEFNERMEVQMRFDCDWLGLEYDTWSRESDLDVFYDQWIEANGFTVEPDLAHVHYYAETTTMLTRPDIEPYPYTPTLTAKRVFFDWMQQINLTVRGEELMTEYSLYHHYCRLWKLPVPQLLYLPRLRSSGGGEISKSKGGFEIATLRACGYKPSDVIGFLERSCLRNPRMGWDLWNLKEGATL